MIWVSKRPQATSHAKHSSSVLFPHDVHTEATDRIASYLQISKLYLSAALHGGSAANRIGNLKVQKTANHKIRILLKDIHKMNALHVILHLKKIDGRIGDAEAVARLLFKKYKASFEPPTLLVPLSYLPIEF